MSGIGGSPTAALISFHFVARCVDIAHSCPRLIHPGLSHRCFHCTSEDRDILKVCDLFLLWTFSAMQAYVVGHHKSVLQEICVHRKRKNTRQLQTFWKQCNQFDESRNPPPSKQLPAVRSPLTSCHHQQLDVVIRRSPAILVLLACENQTLLVQRNTFLCP